ncbi:MAG TPA: transglycosylase SLT domain-containing protein [Opitutaceae bacterium]
MKNGLIAAATCIVLAGCAPRPGGLPAAQPGSLEARREIWAAVQPLAARKGVDAQFVYALIRAESNFDPRAHRGEARGLMQVKRRAWESVTDDSYDRHVWEWRANLGVGVDLLGNLKASLERRGHFSYALLWASYHYGLEYVAARGFDMGRIPRPADSVARRLWEGDRNAFPPPR